MHLYWENKVVKSVRVDRMRKDFRDKRASREAIRSFSSSVVTSQYSDDIDMASAVVANEIARHGSLSQDEIISFGNTYSFTGPKLLSQVQKVFRLIPLDHPDADPKVVRDLKESSTRNPSESLSQEVPANSGNRAKTNYPQFEAQE